MKLPAEYIYLVKKMKVEKPEVLKQIDDMLDDLKLDCDDAPKGSLLNNDLTYYQKELKEIKSKVLKIIEGEK